MDNAFTPLEYLRSTYILLTNLYHGNIYGDFLIKVDAPEYRDFQNRSFRTIKEVYEREKEHIIKGLESQESDDLAKLYCIMMMFDRSALNLETKFGTRLDKLIAGSIPFIDHQLASVVMNGHCTWDVNSRRQMDAMSEMACISFGN